MITDTYAVTGAVLLSEITLAEGMIVELGHIRCIDPVSAIEFRTVTVTRHRRCQEARTMKPYFYSELDRDHRSPRCGMRDLYRCDCTRPLTAIEITGPLQNL